MSWAIREIAKENFKLMPNGVARLDANGVWTVDYIKGDYSGGAKSGTPTIYAYERIAPQEAGTFEPDWTFGPLPGDAELVHFAGWADRKPVAMYHRGNPDISSSLMLAVGPRVPEAWFAANAPQTPADGTGGAGPPPPPETLGGQVLARLDALGADVAELGRGLGALATPAEVRDLLLAMDETNDQRAAYGLPVTFANRLQNYVAYAIAGLLTDEDFLREWVAALDRATAPAG